MNIIKNLSYPRFEEVKNKNVRGKDHLFGFPLGHPNRW